MRRLRSAPDEEGKVIPLVTLHEGPDGTYFDPTDHAANCEFSKPGVCIPAVKAVC